MAFQAKTVNGHALFEVVSALQKAIRRGHVDDALYWAVDMHLSGYGEYLWRRLLVITCEDIGLANPDAIVQVRALRETYVEMQGTSPKHCPERLPLVQAVVLLATSKKSRVLDYALLVHYMDHANQYRDIPDYAYDMHTQVGKAKGRGIEHFLEEGAVLRPLGDDKHPFLEELDTDGPYLVKWYRLAEAKTPDRLPPEKKTKKGQASFEEFEDA